MRTIFFSFLSVYFCQFWPSAHLQRIVPRQPAAAGTEVRRAAEEAWETVSSPSPSSPGIPVAGKGQLPAAGARHSEQSPSGRQTLCRPGPA